MPSPALVSEAKRLGIIGANADYRRDDYHFQREQRPYTPPLERLPRPTSFLFLLLATLLSWAGIAGLFLTLQAVADYLRH